MEEQTVLTGLEGSQPVDLEKHPSGLVPTLQNVVSTVNMGCRLELKEIALHARNAEYNPKRFAAVIMRIREPKTTALIFASGKMIVLKQVNEPSKAIDMHARCDDEDFGSRIGIEGMEFLALKGKKCLKEKDVFIDPQKNILTFMALGEQLFGDKDLEGASSNSAQGRHKTNISNTILLKSCGERGS